MTTIYQEKDKIDYGAVINVHLMRIARVRSRIATWGGARGDILDTKTGVTAYFYTVDTLYNILLPQLRGRAGEYLDQAFYLLSAYMHFATYRYQEENSPTSKWREYYAQEREKWEKIYLKRIEELPEDIEVKLDLYHRPIVELIDKALEEMLIKLNEAGLLMRGSPIKVGYL